MRVTTRAGLLVFVLAVAGTLWYVGGGPREGRNRSDNVIFEANWQVFSHDLGKHVRSDSAAVVWHAGDVGSYNQVHYGGKYRGSRHVGRGTHILTLRVDVDADTHTTCKIRVGNTSRSGVPSDTGVCSVSLTVTI